jgi:hypothetical protein
MMIEKIKKRHLETSHLHPGVDWEVIESRLSSNPVLLEAVLYMEETGGEPIVLVDNSKQLAFYDGSKETPNRRSVCYDQSARIGRKKFPPETSCTELCEEHHLELLDEEEYLFLQSRITCDQKTSSWIKTPNDIRSKGGALFADYRYGKVFVYHNGADSYYAARGFRVKVVLGGKRK